MEIKARLKVLGSNEVNAVLLNDEGEEYPVFLKSLHNTLIFPTLIESGYKLNSLPYGFIKDGVEFNQLPIQVYQPSSDKEIENMYNSIGVPVSQEELKKHIDVTEVRGLPLPRTEYTIFTREEFLSYLQASASTDVDDDFMPINFFVAPSARFSLKEYMSEEYNKYVHILNARREMSITKFYKLVEWLKQFGLPANYTFMDVLDAYFAWGMDGLDFTVMNRSRMSSAVKLVAGASSTVPVINITRGLIDGAGNQYVPENQKHIAWTCEANTPDLVASAIQGLKPNETRVVKFTAPSRTDITTLEGPNYNIRYSEEILVMQQKCFPPIYVKAIDNAGTFIDPRLALPNNKEALYEDALLRAIARYVYKRRKPDTRVSTFEALTASGLNPKTALRYVTTSLNLTKASYTATSTTLADENRITDVPLDAIESYLNGQIESLDAEVKSVIDDIISGTLSIDNIGAAKEADNTYGATFDRLYNELYAVHHCMGISYDEIMNTIRMCTEEKPDAILSANGLVHIISLKKSTAQLRGYMADLRDYSIKNANDCSFFTYITLVAKEVGDERATRHVGMEFYFANRTKKAVEEIISDLVNKFENRVTYEITDINKQAALLRMKMPFALNRYFEIALNGTLTWPKDLGGNTEPVSAELRAKARQHLERRIECIVPFCDFTANPVSSNNLKFNAYCTNAIITPERIIPRTGCTIKEIPFYTAWVDWRSTNPGVWQQLVSLGVLDPNFVAWELRYYEEQFIQRDMFALENQDTLLHYYNHAVSEVSSYPKNLDFIAVEHPIQYLYPGLFMDDDGDINPYADCVTLPAPREGEPVVRLGLCKDIVESDYSQFIRPSQVIAEPSTYIRRFVGFDIDTLLAVPNVLEKLPEYGKPLVVQERSQSIYIGDTSESIGYLRINELVDKDYPVVHIYDRVYVLRSADGKLWEVRI